MLKSVFTDKTYGLGQFSIIIILLLNFSLIA